MNAKEIQHLASLAAISIDNEQTAQFAEEFSAILDYVNTVKEAKTDGFNIPEYHTETLREDSPEYVFSEDIADKILEQTPARNNRYVQVKAVLKK